jgi:hypothetical protein
MGEVRNTYKLLVEKTEGKEFSLETQSQLRVQCEGQSGDGGVRMWRDWLADGGGLL